MSQGSRGHESILQDVLSQESIALPVSPLCTHPHKTQIHRPGACNDRTTTIEQHGTDSHKPEETHRQERK